MKTEIDPRDQPFEAPIITIEPDPAPRPQKAKKANSAKLAKIAIIATIVIAIIAIIATFAAIRRFTAPRSTAADPALAALAEPFEPQALGVEPVSDTILGVPMDFYPLQGLRAGLERELPDPADSSLVLFFRSADYHPDGRALDPVIVRGEYADYKPAEGRDGYAAVSPSGRLVIGIHSGPEVENWARENGGDFFRQQVLLTDGELPREFLLHGKVQRAAIASAVDGSLFYVVTPERESMYDFTDALREYGFVDAIYITGGDAYTFHRAPSGEALLPEATQEKLLKYASKPLPQPLLTFRRN